MGGAALLAAASTAIAGCGSGLAGEAPDQILLAAAQALRGIHSYRLTLTSRQAGGAVTFDVAVAQPGRFDGILSSQGMTAHIRGINGRVYYRGKKFLAAFLPPALASRAGDGWVAFPSQSGGGLGTWSFLLNPDQVADCLQFEHGSLTRGSTTVVRGARAIAVQDKGDTPGATPTTYDVATSGTPWLVRMDVGGAPMGGGELTCGPAVGGGGGVSGSATFTSFGQAYAITVPKGAVDASGGG